MSGLVERLRGDVTPEHDMQALCREAADMIDALNSQLDTCVKTMNTCIADYQRLRHIAIDGDLKEAYELGVRHAMNGEAGHITLTGEEREAIRWFTEYGDLQSEARRAEVLAALLKRLG
jgi:hypothetical protein